MKIINEIVDIFPGASIYRMPGVDFVGDCFPYELMTSHLQSYYLDDFYTLAIL